MKRKKHPQLGYGMYGGNYLMVGGVGLTTTPAYGLGNNGPNEVNSSQESQETATAEAAEGASTAGSSDGGAAAGSGATSGGSM
jgi:hypothetical protein